MSGEGGEEREGGRERGGGGREGGREGGRGEGRGGEGREGGREGRSKGSNVSVVLTRNGKEWNCFFFVCVYSSSSSAQLNIVTPSGKPAIMKKASCFKMALWLVTYHEFFAKSVSAL